MKTRQGDMLPLPASEMDKDADVPITRRQATFSVSLLLETIGWGWGRGHPDTCLEVKGQLQGELRLSGLAIGVPA